MRHFRVDMLRGPLLPNVLAYTVPIILTSILQLLFNTADLIVVGRFCGSISVGAVGSTGALTNLMVSLFIGLSVGVGVSVAQGLGAHDDEGVFRIIHTAIPTALICGAFLSVLGIIFSKNLLQLMATPENVLGPATIYMQICFGGMIFNITYNYCAAILNAAGDTKGPLIFLTAAGIINVILNVIFVALFKMNVDGVALATILSQAVAAFLIIHALVHREDACRLQLRKMHIYKPQLIKMIRIGLPAGIQGSLFSISNVIIQSSVNSFGEICVSGSAASSSIEGFVYVSINSFYQTAMNFTGQNVGADQMKRVPHILWTCIACIVAVGSSLGLLVNLFGPQLLSVYITDSKEAIEFGTVRLAYICLPYFLCGAMDTTTGVLRGLGSSLKPMVISVLGICGLRILWIYTIFTIPAYHTPGCLFASYPISWFVTLTLELAVFYKMYYHIIRRKSTIHPEKYVL